MVDLEYLREVKRGASDGAIPIYRTRYSASDKLLELLGPMAPHEIASNLTVPPNEDPIRVQSKEKHRIEGKAEPAETKVRVEYQETALSTRMRRDIGIINDLLERTDLQLPGYKDYLAGVDQVYPTDLSRKTLHHVFNDTTFKIGGRFYGGWWQSLPSEMRAAITIDGDDVVECDYGTLHPKILYLEHGAELPGDAYDILEEKNDRDARIAVKRAFNAMVNASRPLMRAPSKLDMKKTGLTWRELSQRILDKHHAIEDAFYSAQGLRLQYIDSQLAERVMLNFANKGVPVLPVHDSFIIAAQHQQELVAVMKRVFGERFGGADIKVTVK